MLLLRKALQSPFLSVLLAAPCAYAAYFVGTNLVMASNSYCPAYPYVGMAKAIVICHKSP